MKPLSLIFALICSLLAFCQADDNNKPNFAPISSTYYTKYSGKEFLALEALNQSIDFENPDMELLNAAVFHLTNNERQKRKLKPLQYSPALRNAAQFHSEQMRDLKFYSHTNKKNEAFATHRDRIRYFGGKLAYTGENIYMLPAVKIRYNYEYVCFVRKSEYAATSLTYLELSRQLVKGWMNSPGHRANILNKNFKYLGCGNALPLNPSKSKKRIYNLSTQNFGS